MGKGKRGLPPKTVSYAHACDVLEHALRGPLRREFVAESLRGRDFGTALKRLRSAMSAHAFRTASGHLQLGGIVRAFDTRTRKDGIHVLEEWDQGAHHFSRESLPILMLDYFSRSSAPAHHRPRALALLLDYYFLYVLALFVMRAWDEGDPNQNLDRLSGLLRDLQGPGGSGQRFVEDAATLLFVATSNYQPDDQAYHRLLERVRELDEKHRLDVALIGGPVLGTHLRWALTAIYERDLVRMRDDNFVDYPWLAFSVVTLMKAYARLQEAGVGGEVRERVTNALLNGLSADPWAFVAKPPPALAELGVELADFRTLFERHHTGLLQDFEAHAPSADVYSPIALQFNFPHNTLVAIVVLALLASIPLPNLPLDALLSRPRDRAWTDEEAELLARSVTGYAAAHPEQRGDRQVLIVAYNPPLGLRSFTRTLAALRKEASRGSGEIGSYVGGSDQSSMPIS
jgi:hypothetical protein